jgi:rubrerythrin
MEMCSNLTRREGFITPPVSVGLERANQMMQQDKKAEEDGKRGCLKVLSVVAAVVIVFPALFLFSFQNWRCPVCGYLGKDWVPRFCPNCDVALS